MSEADKRCECGEPLPCSYCTVTIDMRVAHQALMRLNPIQRGRILCWFCSTCSQHIGPGQDHRCPFMAEREPPAVAPLDKLTEA